MPPRATHEASIYQTGSLHIDTPSQSIYLRYSSILSNMVEHQGAIIGPLMGHRRWIFAPNTLGIWVLSRWPQWSRGSDRTCTSVCTIDIHRDHRSWAQSATSDPWVPRACTQHCQGTVVAFYYQRGSAPAHGSPSTTTHTHMACQGVSLQVLMELWYWTQQT